MMCYNIQITWSDKGKIVPHYCLEEGATKRRFQRDWTARIESHEQISFDAIGVEKSLVEYEKDK